MNKMNIKVGGGAVSVGNIVQGKSNVVSAGNVATSVDTLFRDFVANLPALALPYERPDSEVASLAHEVERLKAAATAPQPNVAEGKGIMKKIRDNFSWAYPAVKDLALAAWPAVLAALLG